MFINKKNFIVIFINIHAIKNNFVKKLDSEKVDLKKGHHDSGSI